MIKIKTCIFDENEIKYITQINNKTVQIMFKNDRYFYVQGTFEDIEWNYENNISESLSYDLAKARIEELEERNRTFEDYNKDLNRQIEKLEEDLDAEKSTSSNLARRISKSIEYIKQHCEIRRYEDKGIDEIGKVEGISLLKILKGEE